MPPLRPLRERTAISVRGRIIAGFAAFLLLIAGRPSVTTAQENRQPAKPASTGKDTGQATRGKYIVQSVAACGNCHTPRKPNGELDYSRWLAGGPVPYLPAQPAQDWPLLCPRIGGLPPASDAQMLTLLTTGIWTDGKPLRSPMPEFHMTLEDAQAVLSYLKSVNVRGGGAQ
jgi:mono/diheme cytochrome c family protein